MTQEVIVTITAAVNIAPDNLRWCGFVDAGTVGELVGAHPTIKGWELVKVKGEDVKRVKLSADRDDTPFVGDFAYVPLHRSMYQKVTSLGVFRSDGP